jgi:hypothetical protein
MKKKYAFIIPYFGKLPNWFQLWLNSCDYNQIVDWLLFTDDRTHYRYPPNVKVYYCTFEDVQKLVQSNFDFRVSLRRPYKLCAYKPAYGEIFSSYLMDYDFWGYCDIDLIWGNLGKWIANNVIDDYDRISHWGHCSLYKNTKEINALYKTNIKGVNYYKDVYTTETINGFDEECGMNVITRAVGIKEYIIPFVDVKPAILSYGFTPTFTSDPFFSFPIKQMCFMLKEGNLIMYSLKNGSVHSQEFAYVHLQRRKMAVEIDDESKDYIIIPNKFVPYQRIDSEYIKKVLPSEIKEFMGRQSGVWKSRYRIIKDRILK